VWLVSLDIWDTCIHISLENCFGGKYFDCPVYCVSGPDPETTIGLKGRSVGIHAHPRVGLSWTIWLPQSPWIFTRLIQTNGKECRRGDNWRRSSFGWIAKNYLRNFGFFKKIMQLQSCYFSGHPRKSTELILWHGLETQCVFFCQGDRMEAGGSTNNCWRSTYLSPTKHHISLWNH